MDDLEAASSRMGPAVSNTPEEHPDRARWLRNLGKLLLNRYIRTRNVDDLESVVSRVELAVSAIHEDSLDRAQALNDLAVILFYKYMRTENMNDLQAALRTCISSFNLSRAIPIIRVRAARLALYFLVSMQNWDQASSLAQAAIELLPFVCGRYSSRKDQQYVILEISGLAADACSLSLKGGHVHQALQNWSLAAEQSLVS